VNEGCLQVQACVQDAKHQNVPVFFPSRCLDVGFAPQLGYPAGVKVGDVLDRLREDGWFIVAMKGSHRQFKHASKPGRVTVAGKPSDDLPPGTLNSIFKQAGWKKGAY
jgi:predicted RNA binding protein YcfA (HicA-like mRNA interferase family)